ncbi:putative dna-directed rna polymerase [Diaporthe ampelina]|uniref:Putative dna-directed rna polymerase n=1 Tax=Diaporthe ampelina TaxID=1214573 RepID=A0A0G2FV60_9PEZI|nr:putative dna-directed rna polymerase [Diaporthe ampelina]
MSFSFSSASATMIALLVATMAGLVEPHMIMATPKPYGDPDNSPLTSANYPCKVTSDPATFYKTDGIIDQNSMVAGETQTLSFSPSANTSWRVLLSIESGCPSKDGSSPSTYDYTIPSDLTPGHYSFAWTWISKLAGQPEYYMNCAPIAVTAGKAKRDSEGVSLLPRDDSYVELFVGNLADINSCKSTPSTDPIYPEPGQKVETLGASPSLSSVSGSDCVAKGQTTGAGPLPTATAGDTGGGAAAGTAPAASASATASPAGGQQSSSPSRDDRLGGIPDFILGRLRIRDRFCYLCDRLRFLVRARVHPGRHVRERVLDIQARPIRNPLPSGTCTSEGMFNCIGTQYQQCASGAWTAMKALPGGTTCQQGESENLWARDTTRPNRARKLRWGGKRWVTQAA